MTAETVRDIAREVAWKMAAVLYFATCVGKGLGEAMVPPPYCEVTLAVAHNAADSARVYDASENCRP
jgi:hypothetical protein